MQRSRYARHLHPPPVLLMVVLLRTRSFVSVGILVLTVAPTRSLVGSSTSVFIVPNLTKGKLELASPALAKKSDKWLPTCTLNEHDSFPQEASFATLSPLEDCPLNYHAWERELLHDPDRECILEGLRTGFKLITDSDPSSVDSYDNDNYTSATCPEF